VSFASPASWGLADAVAAGTLAPVDWVDVPYVPDDVVLTVPADALRIAFPSAGGRVMRAPCSYREQVQVARDLGCVSASVDWARAIWRAAPRKQAPVELVRTPADAQQMGTLAFLVRAEDLRDAAVTGYSSCDWGRGAMKGWYVDPLMLEQGDDGACNWGFVHPPPAGADPTPAALDACLAHPDQTPGGRHNWFQIDYSQTVYDLPKRAARRISDGSPIDLVELLVGKFAANARLVARIRAEYGG
jgi:hypothetical protein